MGLKAYSKGRRLEYKVKHRLEAKGWYVVRSAGSKGLIDLVAIKPKKVLLIQVKRRKPGKRYLKKLADWESKYGRKILVLNE